MIPEPYQTQCYCWGSGAGGALGGSVKIQLSPKRFHVPRKYIQNAYAGDRRTIALASNGDAYSWGNDPLGRKCAASNKSLARKITKLSSVLKVAHGSTHSVAIDTRGRAFSFGDAEEGKLGLKLRRRKVELPTEINLNEKCVDAACGVSFTVLLLSTGEIIMYGLTGMNNCHKKLQPQRFHLPSVQIISVASGASHCAAITTKGQVYTWGMSENGRLGHGLINGNADMVQTPTCVKYLCEQKIVVMKVACGSAHTALVTDRGELFSFGWNYYNQCGTSERDVDYYLPEKVQGNFEEIESISCGFAHTAFITILGDLYCFGFNENGELGIGHEKNVPVPTLVKLTEKCENICVIHVSCGKMHTVAVVAKCTISEYRGREKEVDDANKASEILLRFFRLVVLLNRLDSFSRQRLQKEKENIDDNPADNDDSKHGSSTFEKDTEDSVHSSESIASPEWSPKYDQDAIPSCTYPSRISEMMAMEAEEDLGIELCRKHRIYRSNLQRKQRNVLLEVLRRHEAHSMCQEDICSLDFRKIRIKEAKARKDIRNEEINNSRIHRIRSRAEKLQSEMKSKGNLKMEKPRRKGRRKTRQSKTEHLLYRKKVKPKHETFNEPKILPSRNKNKRLLRQRSERIRRQQKEKRDLEEHVKLQKMQEIEQLHKFEEARKRRAITKVEKLKSIINIERQKNDTAIIKLQRDIFLRRHNGDTDKGHSQEFKSVRQWSRHAIS